VKGAPTVDGWLPCDGRLLSIQQNQALFSLLGNRFGGTYPQTFAIPDLRGRTPLDAAADHALGTFGGVENVTLTPAQMPAHTHSFNVVSQTGTISGFPGNLYASAPAGSELYGSITPATTQSMAADNVTVSGANQAHNNMQPFLALVFCIATKGNYPPQPME
jgi:microcystin-dependent protein